MRHKALFLMSPYTCVSYWMESFMMIDIVPLHRKRYVQVAVWLRQIRANQWLKNVFVLTPLPFVLVWPDVPRSIVSLAVVFVAFCAAASSIYICNDLVDIERD